MENTPFFHDPDNFHGVGWNNANSNQGFALITPRHATVTLGHLASAAGLAMYCRRRI